MYNVSVIITLRESILDPQGKTTLHALNNLGLDQVEDVRMGKYISLHVDADSEEDAESISREACKKLLANAVMEDFTIHSIQKVASAD